MKFTNPVFGETLGVRGDRDKEKRKKRDGREFLGLGMFGGREGGGHCKQKVQKSLLVWGLFLFHYGLGCVYLYRKLLGGGERGAGRHITVFPNIRPL